jgi:outer membrane lipoprotein-sorting protein
MKPMNDLEQAIRDLPLQPRADLEHRILTDTVAGMQPTASAPPAAAEPALRIAARIMHGKWHRFAVAAAIAAAALGTLRFILPGASRDAMAFGQVLQNIRAARSVSFHQTNIEGSGLTSESDFCYLAPGRFRTSYIEPTKPDGCRIDRISITDIPRRRSLYLSTGQRQATVYELVDIERRTTPWKEDPLEEIRKVTDRDGQYIGRQAIDGRQVDVFRVGTNVQDITVSVDPSTGLAVRVEMAVRAHDVEGIAIPASRSVFTDFLWNADLDPALFDVNPPAGYTVKYTRMDVSEPGQTDLLEALRIATDSAQGDFPEDFTRQSLGIPEIHSVTVSGRADGTMQGPGRIYVRAPTGGPFRIISRDPKMFRAVLFVEKLCREGRDWHYAGAGVKRGQADKPVCWWQDPERPETYVVIYGDLSIREVPADQRPKPPATPQTQPASEGPA